MTNVQVLEEGLYTTKELRIILGRLRRRKVPARTLRYWIRGLQMEKNECGLYDENDLQALVRLVKHLSRGGTIHQLFQVLKQENQQCL